MCGKASLTFPCPKLVIRTPCERCPPVSKERAIVISKMEDAKRNLRSEVNAMRP